MCNGSGIKRARLLLWYPDLPLCCRPAARPCLRRRMRGRQQCRLQNSPKHTHSCGPAAAAAAAGGGGGGNLTSTAQQALSPAPPPCPAAPCLPPLPPQPPSFDTTSFFSQQKGEHEGPFQLLPLRFGRLMDGSEETTKNRGMLADERAHTNDLDFIHVSRVIYILKAVQFALIYINGSTFRLLQGNGGKKCTFP